MKQPTYLDLIDMKESALDKISKAEMTLTEISIQYGQAEKQNIFTTRDLLFNALCSGISPEGAEKQVFDWALEYDQINQKLEIVLDYISACRMILENKLENS